MDLNPLNLPPPLLDIHLTLERGGRIKPEQALLLFEHEDVLTVAAMADAVATRKWNRRAFYERPLRVPLSPTCGPCRLCDERDPDPISYAAAARPREVHLHSLPPDASLEQVEALVARLRERLPEAWLQGLTAHEVARLVRPDAALDHVVTRLQQAGLDGILGTHEEIYTREGRALIGSPLPDGESPGDDDEALEVHAAAHRAGLASVASLAYAHTASHGDLVAAMDAIREVQRKTAGFSVFAPLPRALAAGQRKSEAPSGYEDVRMVAVGRLFFDNIPHVRAPWLALGLKMGQVALSFGADDLGWTMFDPHVGAFAPSTSFSAMTVRELERAAMAARRSATEVDGAWRETGCEVTAR
jgi:aminodeoxyfutalosine synthase